MQTTLTQGKAPVDDRRLAAEELRADALRSLAFWVMVCGVVALAFLFDRARPVTWLPALSLTAAGYLTVRLTKVASVAAAVTLIVALWLILTGSILLYPGVPLAPLYGLIIFPAAFLLGPRIAALIAVASVGALFGGDQIAEGLVPPEIRSIALFTIFGTAILSWVFVRPLATALDWVWAAYAQAEAGMAEARTRQGELARVTKSLAESLARLEELNRRLAEARAAAEKARRLKAEFAAAVSHELRTPLNIIIGFAELLVVPGRARQATPVPDACRRQLEAIYRNACHISNLVDDILDLSQIDAHRLALHKEPVFLQDVVTEALDAVQHLFEDEGLSLTVDVPASIPQLQADRTRLRQILINLLSNAGRFTDEGGVAIRARTDNHDVVVEVSDTGIGIPPQHLPLVFGEFHQLGQPGRGGSGLGLSICKRLVELHGGNAWVESVVGQGSTFSFSLPLGGTVAATPDSPSLERSIAAITGREAERTVIVVDDDDGTSKIISRYLDGYHVEGVPGTPSPPPSLRGRGERGERAAAIVYCRPEDAESWRAARSTLPPGRTSPPGPPFLSGSDPERGDDVEGGEWRGEGMGPPGVVVFCPMRTIRHAQQELGVAGYLTKPVAPGQLRAALQRLGTRWRSVGIVEDHPEMADLLAEMVSATRRRCRVWRATDGREALALLRERRPDVLLLDLLLPGLSGYQVLDEMRRDEGLREVPVLVITGAEDRDERVLVEMVSITRPGGMTVGEAMACLKHGLDSLCGTRWQTSVT